MPGGNSAARLYHRGLAMKKLTFIAAMVLAVPAHADVKSFQGPGGRAIHKVTCQSDETECYQQAASVCGKSYQVMSSESHAGGIFADWIPGPVTWYSMNVRCGESDGRTAQFNERGAPYVPPRPFYMECSGNNWGVGCGGWR
jgi:hypothetical protein